MRIPPISEAILFSTSMDIEIDRSVRRDSYLEWIKNSANWICSGVPEIVTCRSCEPSSKSAILMFAPDACLARRRGLHERRWRRSEANLPNLRDLLSSSTNDTTDKIVGNGDLTLSLHGRTIPWKTVGHQRRWRQRERERRFLFARSAIIGWRYLPAGRGTPGPSWANGP